MNRGKALIILLVLLAATSTAQPIVEHGIINLTNRELINNKVITLNGNWEFFWNQHLTPSDFTGNNNISPDIYGYVPAYWTSYADTIREITPQGFATYRLRILLPEYFRNNITFKVPVFESSYRIYIDGKMMGSNGLPGTRHGETKPGYKPAIIDYFPLNDTIEIIINVSNYHHRRGGFWQPMAVGLSEEMHNYITRERAFSSSAIGMLAAFSGFFFIFFLIFRRDRTMLYFSLATAGIMIRSLFTGYFTAMAFINIPWIWIVRMEYTGTYLALIFSLLYFLRMFGDPFIKYINAVLISLFGSLILVVNSTPVTFFSYSILIFYPVIIVTLLYYSLRSLMVLITKRNYEGLMAPGFLILITGTLNDILNASSVSLITRDYILPYAVLIFIMIQAVILIFKWVRSFNEEKRLHDEIENINSNLEKLVIERTTELTNQKGILQRQYELIDNRKRELEKSIQIKNRVFSIIAHDLKTPVLTLKLMLDNYLENPDKKRFNQITATLRSQSDNALDLIENLLLWGQAQQDSIAYNPGVYNMTDIILKSFNLFRKTAEEKEITLSYSHRGDPRAICDIDLTDIVLRNLISNSIKFTGRGGNISVTVTEPPLKNGTIDISVRDNGIGIPDDRVKTLFSPDSFFSTFGTENEKGTGLGLQLCYELIRINKGSIRVESEEGTGTKFIIMLPTPAK
ncbi:MAG: sensor histidine kinase [Bacteroidales bacterium]|nr:sensor histidine kinase [Bacteroidales bacterium]